MKTQFGWHRKPQFIPPCGSRDTTLLQPYACTSAWGGSPSLAYIKTLRSSLEGSEGGIFLGARIGAQHALTLLLFLVTTLYMQEKEGPPSFSKKNSDLQLWASSLLHLVSKLAVVFLDGWWIGVLECYAVKYREMFVDCKHAYKEVRKNIQRSKCSIMGSLNSQSSP